MAFTWIFSPIVLGTFALVLGKSSVCRYHFDTRKISFLIIHC